MINDIQLTADFRYILDHYYDSTELATKVMGVYYDRSKKTYNVMYLRGIIQYTQYMGHPATCTFHVYKKYPGYYLRFQFVESMPFRLITDFIV